MNDRSRASVRIAVRSALFAMACCACAPALADEGMWTFDAFPIDRLAREHGVELDQAWLDRVRLGTVRLSNCTASFVSPDGLIFTNHHCIASCLAEHSSRTESLLETGFHARRRDEELLCGTQVADVLVDIEEITARVQAATEGLGAQAANEARKRELTTIAQECEDAANEAGTPLKCETVTLYDGGQYFLYRYRRYDDVRLVFAPEQAIAAFGGDPDNFQFPRWCLDFGFLRAYEDGEPAATPDHLSIDFDGPSPGDVVFVAGHPGSTDRLLTVAQLKTLRDVDLPSTLLRASELRGRYIQFAKTSPEAERIVRDPLNGLENTIKVRRKQLDALHDDAELEKKAAAEAELRRRVLDDERLAALVGGDPWAEIEAAQEAYRAIALPYTFIEQGAGFNSRLFRYARTLVRAATERTKPNTERLPEYAETELPRLRQQIEANVPVYPELEKLTLSFSLERMREYLGPDHPLVRELLAADSADTLAASLVEGSTLGDPAERLALWEGGLEAIERSDDPMIALARDIDDEARAVRKRYEDEVEAPVDRATEAIALARFELYGTDVYPDATFTLRLNYGTVQGWIENGEPVDPITRLDRLYERATGQPPFALPQSWLDARPQLDPDTPFNVATNNDIVGGNSGSPLIDVDGNVVGIMFDGNIHSISGAYWFDDAKNRAIAVATPIIRVALADVYGADGLLDELGAGSP
ncbi:MAG TPA: S46 family peptidase [Gammaproteobacteria bacterium]